ncbi:hypothetical protein BT93_K1102 [Corymbia citriodora subsp. variegata]|nr:hypothetical protein BT93_K1102 [Corymbia citriodora subsp. variegata]
MPKSGAQQNPPPPGYPTDNLPHTRKMKFLCCGRTQMKGNSRDRGFIEGCLFALCCCWLCEECCD